MSSNSFPRFVLADWQSTRDTIQTYAIFEQFQGQLRGETSPVQLCLHHIDLAFLRFTGRLVPGVDPKNEERPDGQNSCTSRWYQPIIQKRN